jgi:hypothetical protein
MKFESLKPGMSIYDVHSHNLGRTTMKTVGVWEVKVIELHPDRSITASWNGNRPQKISERHYSKYRLKRPELERAACGAYRLKKRATSPKIESTPVGQ